jgi:hydroxymethylbilane synthase
MVWPNGLVEPGRFLPNKQDDDVSKIVIGTRGSKLALWQAGWVRDRLQELQPDVAFDIKIIKTTGDVRHDLSPEAFGSEGIFTAELDRGLLAEEIDLAVHSLKDLPTTLAPGLALAAVTERETIADVFILHKRIAEEIGVSKKEMIPADLENAKRKIVVGTSSLRRIALLKDRFPKLEFDAMRGNLDTRIHKLAEKQVDALVVAEAGLVRLGIETGDHPVLRLVPDWYLPAAGQGALALESREHGRARQIAAKLAHTDTDAAVTAERVAMSALGAGCRVPAGFLGTVDGDQVLVSGVVGSPAGGRPLIRASAKGPLRHAVSVGRELADKLLSQGAKKILGEVRG